MKRGKKDQEWSEERTKLKQWCEENGITTCQLRLKGCWREVDGFAHSEKRRHLGKWGSEERAENLREVIAVCNYCHNIIESDERMKDVVVLVRRHTKKKLSKWKKV